jgi:hypothetical protein
MPSKPLTSKPLPQKRLLQNCLAEIRWMLAFWLATFAWVIGYSLTYGRQDGGQEPAVLFGFPAWVFWGVGVPWLAATLFTCWFALAQMSDDALEVERETNDPEEETTVQP